jgi:uncharacterized protein YbjT (DUF2867 family)
MSEPTFIQRVAVFGGSGFLGSEISKHLAAQGLRVRIAVRHPQSDVAAALARQSSSIETVYADVRDETSVGFAVEDCEAVVNAVSLYREKGGETFERVHEIGAINVAHQAVANGIRRLVHISGIGVDLNSPSPYVHSRGKAELLVADVFEDVTILRPSVMFGPTDKFLNTLDRIATRMPVLPLFGNGQTRLQPVYVGDVAAAVHRAIVGPGSKGKTYELGGPRIYMYRELIETLLDHTNRKRILLPLPFSIWHSLVSCLSVLPNPPLIEAQVTLMKKDNVVSKSALKLADLDLEATSLESVLPQYPFSGGTARRG